MRDFTLSDAAALPLPAKALCVAAAAAIAFGLGYLLVLAELRAEHHAAQRRATTLTAERDQRAHAADALAAAQARRAAAESAFAALLAELPTAAQAPRLVEEITRAAVGRGLAVGEVGLAAEREAPLFAEQPISISASGDYHQVGGFAADLAALPTLVTLSAFELRAATGGNGAKLALAATAHTFRYRDSLEVAPAASPPARAGAAYHAQGRPNPFGAAGGGVSTAPAPNPGRPRQPLERHPLGELRMVGTLATANRRHALIQDPAGDVHRLAVGDYLGPDHGLVRAVRETGLDLVETVRDSAGGWMARPRALALAARPDSSSVAPDAEPELAAAGATP